METEHNRTLSRSLTGLRIAESDGANDAVSVQGTVARHGTDKATGQRYTSHPTNELSRSKESDKAHMATIAATKIATEARIDPKVFREALCDENFEWHRFNHRWAVEAGSDEPRAIE